MLSRFFLILVFFLNLGVSSTLEREVIRPEFQITDGGWVIQDSYEDHYIDIVIQPIFELCTYTYMFLTNLEPLNYVTNYNLPTSCSGEPSASYRIDFLPSHANHIRPLTDIVFSLNPKRYSNSPYFPTEDYKKGIISFNLDVFGNGLLVKTYSVLLDTKTKEAQIYLKEIEEELEKDIAIKNQKRIFMVVIFFIVIVGIIYIFIKLIRYSYKHASEKIRERHIRKTAKNIALEETIKKELDKSEPGELTALKLEIAKAISEDDKAKVDYLLDLAERLKKLD